VILTARSVPGGPSGVLARRRQAIAAIGILLVGYTGAFLLAEPALGASASLLAMLPVAIAGAVFGPEIGIATALLSTIVTAALWNATNHSIGEPAPTHVAVPGGGLELVAAAGAPDELIGHREVAGAVAAAGTANRASIVDDLEARPIGVSVPRSRSGVVVPIAGRGETPSGVI